MNADQRKIVIWTLVGLSVLLVLVFWRIGTQYQYGGSVLVWKTGETESPYYTIPAGEIGLRIRMGTVGVLCGLILPVVMAAAAAFLAKADRK